MAVDAKYRCSKRYYFLASINMPTSYSSRGTRGRRPAHGRSGSGRSKPFNARRGGGRGGFRKRGFQKQTISPSRFINKRPVVQTKEQFTPTHTFGDFGFAPAIVKNLTDKGYVHPTRIQDEAIPHILRGKDTVGLANTGSGKTAAFILPVIHNLFTQGTYQTALVVTPTRELAQQIQQEFRQFTKGMKMYSALCVGGMSMRNQIRDLRRNPHVIIGTPGRLRDLMIQNELDLSSVKIAVLDEADRMLDMGFLPDISCILDKVPSQRQTLCFSATTTPAISKLFESIMNKPAVVSVRTSETGEHIAQDVVVAKGFEDKFNELVKMLDRDEFEKVLVFGETKRGVRKLTDLLRKKRFRAEDIHGDKSQPQRLKALAAFKNNKANILVATDVAARGLDIPLVSHVINFDQPQGYDDYIHRIGRTGRAGNAGQAYTFVDQMPRS